MVFEGVISALVSAGVFGLYLPFLLIFAIFFALLQKTKIFGDKAQKINGIISIIASLYLVAFSPVSETIGLWFAMVFATTGVVLVSILVMILVVGLLVAPWWTEDRFKGKDVPKALIGLGIIIGGLILIGAGFGNIGPGGMIEIPGLTSQDMVFLILIVITIIILYWLVGGEAGKKGRLFLPFQKE